MVQIVRLGSHTEMINSYRQITRKEFYDLGGFANSNLFRKHNGKHWTYWIVE